MRFFLVLCAVSLLAWPSNLWAQESQPTDTTALQVSPDHTRSDTEAGTEADAAGPLAVGASMFTRYEVREGYGLTGDAERADMIRYRARLVLSTRPLRLNERLTATVTFAPQAGGFWFVGGQALEDASLGLHAGYLTVAGRHHALDIGRMALSYGDELVLGAVGWHHLGRSFDVVRARFGTGQAGWLHLFASPLSEGATLGIDSSVAAGDRYFVGAYAGLGPEISSATLEGYFMGVITPRTDELSGYTEGMLGARIVNNIDSFRYRVELNVQAGTRPNTPDNLAFLEPLVDVLAYQADLELRLSLVESRLDLSLEAFFASGDDPDTPDADESYFQYFPTAHKWLGTMDFVGARTNVAGLGLQAAYDTGGWRSSLHTQAFVRPVVPEGSDGYFGTEIDLGVVRRIGGGLAARFGYGLFLPNEGDPLHFGELELRFEL